jgi:hypothetical protein
LALIDLSVNALVANALRRGLRELGCVDGQTIALELRDLRRKSYNC